MRFLIMILCSSSPVEPAASAAVLAGGTAESACAQVELQVRDVEWRLEQLRLRFADENEKFDRSISGAALEAAGRQGLAPGAEARSESEERLEGLLAEQKRAMDPLIIEMTVLARRLQRFKETGELPEEIPDMDQVEELVRNPWKTWNPLPWLEEDLPALIEQMKPFDDIDRRFPMLARTSKAEEIPRMANFAPEVPGGEPLPAVPPIPRHERSVRLGARMERDAGYGRRRTDRVLELMGLLSSDSARARALAADELGMHGAGAAAAVPALMRALSDGDPRVRASAVMALGSIPGLPQDALEGIRRALDDANQDVRFSARVASGRLELSP